MNPVSEHEVSGIRIEVLNRDKRYTVTEICMICQIDKAGLQQYVDYGVIVTDESEQYRQSQLDRLIRARRLQQDLELNHAGVALALDLLDRIAELKRDLALLSG
ncbi:MAG: molecular chaperone [Granulosicoccus sp.]|nr:molecular chaperone [Granulosicoccus sp.]